MKEKEMNSFLETNIDSTLKLVTMDEALQELKHIKLSNTDIDHKNKEYSTLGIMWGDQFRSFLELIIAERRFLTKEIADLYFEHVLDPNKLKVTYSGQLTLLLRKLSMFYREHKKYPWKPES